MVMASGKVFTPLALKRYNEAGEPYKYMVDGWASQEDLVDDMMKRVNRLIYVGEYGAEDVYMSDWWR